MDMDSHRMASPRTATAQRELGSQGMARDQADRKQAGLCREGSTRGLRLTGCSVKSQSRASLNPSRELESPCMVGAGSCRQGSTRGLPLTG